jgi:hypothetical protein
VRARAYTWAVEVRSGMGFAKGTSDTLIHKWWTATGGWSGWEDLGGRIQYNPSAVKVDSRIEILATGSTAQLEHTWWG